MTDLFRRSAKQLTEGYQRGDFTPQEVTRAVIDRALDLNETLNCFCHIDAERALSDAVESGQRWARGAPLSALDGVPISVKDLLLTKGWPTLFGSLATDLDQAWAEDAPAVSNLRRGGVVFFGKTTTPEWGHKGATDSRRHGITRNPWNTALTPGGSSGGAAAALASGLGPLAIGSDGGGSCRTPANFCGVVGMKPSHGRVPVWPPSTWGHLTTPGPMARTVEDTAQMLSLMSTPDIRDPLTRPDNPLDATKNLKNGVAGLRIALSPGLGHPVKKEIADTIVRAAARFGELGAIVEEAEPNIGDVGELFRTFFFVGAAVTLKSIPKEKHALLEDLYSQVAAIGAQISATDYAEAVRASTDLRQRMAVFHQKYDLILTATNAVLPYPVGMVGPAEDSEGKWDNITATLFPINLSGQPAITIPCGHAQNGLPIGLQLVAAAGHDDLVLRAAYSFEEAAGLPNQMAPI
ncbi:MAG: amidase [Alphaproteobacteria bacterium]|nr:amidase [Alphaproteobacteria bacterium]